MTSLLPNLILGYQSQEGLLAPYAMHSCNTHGRIHAEPAHSYRGAYQRDRDRIIHSSAFRRLAHKTQVFTGERGDYHRSRLTHTMEVASVARTLGRALHLNEDLIESLALLHDVGHPPFGHAGEDVLNHCLQDHGGFNHNRQALRLAEQLETRYPEFPGLNLSHEVLAGQLLRTLRSEAKQGKAKSKWTSADLPQQEPALRLWEQTACKQMLLEIQVVDAADSFAYDTHDADDALEMNLLDLEQLSEVPLWREAARQVRNRYASLNSESMRRAIIHQLIELFVSDLLTTTQTRLAEANITSVQDVREHPGILAAPSKEIQEKKQELEDFLFAHVYRHPSLLERRHQASQSLQELFHALVAKPERLPASKYQAKGASDIPRTVADYLASMTDRFAMESLQKMRT